MALTEFAARNAKPREKEYKLSDGGGLYLLIRPNGAKLWRHKYRFAGKEKLLSYGAYPLITIAEARVQRDEAKKLLAAGKDPSAKRRLDKIAANIAAGNTFSAIVAEYLSQMEADGRAEATLIKTRWYLEDLASPLAKRPIAEVTSAEVLDLLRQIERSGRRESAHRMRSAIGRVFRFAIATLRAENDPTIALRGALRPKQVTHRPAILDEKKFGALLCSIDEYDGWPTISFALRFLALTCVRPGEVRGAIRSEFDLKANIWRIPAERMKMREAHEVPLSRQALALLDEIWPLSERAQLVFPSIRSAHRPLSENAMNSALRRIGYTKDEVTSHGFRATASTILNNRGYDPDVIEAILAHQDRNTVRRTYNRAKYWDQRVQLMQEWADLLDQFRTL
ncbi:MAG: tyrosine-type recombinase/integrase [Alphaproteobacteria bacterium]|nr:tyrosine-type recombinase/integrase [Alphaproteobacteria bacterium]